MTAKKHTPPRRKIGFDDEPDKTMVHAGQRQLRNVIALFRDAGLTVIETEREFRRAMRDSWDEATQ